MAGFWTEGVLPPDFSSKKSGITSGVRVVFPGFGEKERSVTLYIMDRP